MIERYTLPEMGGIWTDENRYRRWLDVELAVCEAWAKLGKIPPASLKTIKARAGFSVGRIDEIEKVVKHDVIAFLTSVNEKVGPDGRFIHLGLTSYDVVDTALSLLIRESLEKVLARLRGLEKVLKRQALKYKKTPCIGRTHGVHAEPVTFGFKILVWVEARSARTSTWTLGWRPTPSESSSSARQGSRPKSSSETATPRSWPPWP
jgi:adenylosuccinate lyase